MKKSVIIYCLVVLLSFSATAKARLPNYNYIRYLFYNEGLQRLANIARNTSSEELLHSNKVLSAFLIANTYRLRFNWEQAAKWYKAIWVKKPKEWVWAAAYYAFSLKRLKKYKEAARILQKLPMSSSYYLNARIHYHLGVCLSEIGDDKAVYHLLRASSIDSTLKPFAYQRIASFYLKEKRYKDAYIMAVSLLEENIYNRVARKIFLRVYPTIKKHSINTRFIYAKLLFQNGEYKNALQVFRTIKGITGMYWQAKCLTALKRYSTAISIYKYIVRRFPDNSLTHHALKRLFRIAYYNLKYRLTGIRIIKGTINKLPLPERAYSSYLLYLLYKKSNNHYMKSYWRNILLRKYPNTKYARLLARELGITSYLRRNYKSALKYFKIVNNYYWIALCYKKLKNRYMYRKYLNLERKANPTSYYTTLLKRKIKMQKLPKSYSIPTYWEERAGFVEAAFSRYKRNLIGTKTPFKSYYRIALLSQVFANYRQSMGYAYIYILKRSHNIPQAIWKLYLPKTVYWKYIAQTAERLHLNPYLILALTKHESSFDPMAVSYAGAIGLMQILPGTAKEVLKIKNTNELFIPAINIKAGSIYLYSKLKRLKRLEWAIASYNAGERKVKEWVSGYKKLRKRYSPVEWIEFIKYTETRNYVKQVLSSYHLYKMIYQRR